VKILYLSQYFPPEMGAPGARASELARHWAAEGHEVTVLTGFPNHPTGIVPPEYRKKLRRLVVHENWHGANVTRTWLWPLPNRKAHERILGYSSFCLSSAITGLFAARPDVLVASSPQLLVALSGWWLARCKRVPFVFEVRDLWPESLAAVGMGDSSSLFHRGLARIAGFLYRNCDHIVVVTPAFKEHLVRLWSVSPKKISIVENGVETDVFAPQDATARRKDLGADSKFLISYIGTIGMAHGLEVLLEAARRLQRSNPEVLFLVVGEGADKERVVERTRTLGLSNIRFIGQQSRQAIPGYICASDACVVLLKKSDLFKTVIPTKMLEFMSCGIPVILGVDGQSRRILEEAQAGIYFEPENAIDLAQAVLHLAADAVLRTSLGRNGRRYIVQRLSRSHTARAYIDVLTGLLRRPEPTRAAAA
jgi:glycosyltransferase involved in cell wall biosynthesis